VYLYHTGQGIIAKGAATAGFRRTDYDGDPDTEYYVPLKLEWALLDPTKWGKAVKSWEINARMGAGHRFRQTAFAIPPEMSKTIDLIWDEHNANVE
jgi:hypothetical protein